MKFFLSNKQRLLPNMWDHEPTLMKTTTSYQEASQQLWATVSSMRHQDNQWVTLIGRPSAEFLEQLKRAGIQKERIRCIAPNSTETALWATEQALLLNNSQLVIAWLPHCSKRDERRLQLLANNSKSISFVFTNTNETTQLH